MRRRQRDPSGGAGPRRRPRWGTIAFWIACLALIAVIVALLLTEGTWDGTRDVLDILRWW